MGFSLSRIKFLDAFDFKLNFYVACHKLFLHFLQKKRLITMNPPPSKAVPLTPSDVVIGFLRENKPAQIFLCAMMGIVVGVMTGTLHGFVSLLHHVIFGLPAHEHLSAADHVAPWLLLGVPVAGGLLLGLSTPLMRKLLPGDIIDPIEANAIYGGRMTVTGSLRLLLATLISNGSGISVGMEAAYTQVGSCCLSWVGSKLQLRREDVRIFVAAGAAAAIAAAYNAPLAGAFYGYELVLGNYAIAALPQVTLAALFAVLTLHVFSSSTPIFSLDMGTLDIPVHDYLAFLIVGAVSALVAIIVMKAVTGSEKAFARLPLPEWTRPALGGLAVGLLALTLSPEVLGSGQGGIDMHLHNIGAWPLGFLCVLLVGKMAASSLSIGSGFRGGLFSASLFLGCLLGQICAIVASHFIPVSDTAFATFILAGTGSVAAAVVGAPMTMTLLVLEMTGSFPAMTAVLAGILVSSTVTRYSFGYSFSTWRFHLKGIGISGARDVGWMRDLTVDKLMLPSPSTALANEPLSKLREKVPVASGIRNVFLVDDKGNYQGVVSVGDLHAPAGRDAQLSTAQKDDAPPPAAEQLAKAKDYFLLPRQTLQDALKVFADARKEELPVLAGARKKQIIGYAREEQVLRRYTQELESAHIAQFGN